MVLIVKQSCLFSFGRPLNLHSCGAIVRDHGAVVNNSSLFHLLTDNPGPGERHLFPGLANAWVLPKEPYPTSQHAAAFFWPSSLEPRPLQDLCFSALWDLPAVHCFRSIVSSLGRVGERGMAAVCTVFNVYLTFCSRGFGIISAQT